MHIEDLVADIVKRWALVVLSTILGGLLAFYMLSGASDVYRTSMVLVPVKNDLQAPKSGIMGALPLGNVGSLLGLGGTDRDLERFMLMFSSIEIAERLETKHGVMKTIFASEWNGTTQKWQPKVKNLKAKIRSYILSIFDRGKWTAPNYGRLSEYVFGSILVEPIPKVGALSLTMDHDDPEFAKRWMQMVYEEIDLKLREEAISRTTHMIGYLENKLATISNVEHRQALVGLLAGQERTMMLIQNKGPFKVKVLTPAITKDQPISPRPIRTLALGIVGGGILGIILAILFGTLPRRLRRFRTALRS